MTRHPIAITTSVLEDLHDDGKGTRIITTVAYDDGSVWRHDDSNDQWWQLPTPPLMVRPQQGAAA